MANLCIIPARGGSKRIPGKNRKNFLDKPIIAYSIEAALDSELFDEIMVSTDDKDIAQVAQKYGAQVPFYRSQKNSDDHAILADVMDEVIESYEKQGKSFEYVCCILPTAPFTTPKLLKMSLNQLLKNTQLDSIRPIIKFSYPIQRAVKLDSQTGKIEMFHPENFTVRSQDLEAAYHDAGMFYWFPFSKGMRGENKGGIEIEPWLAQDIDDLQDWKMAEMKYQLLNAS